MLRHWTKQEVEALVASLLAKPCPMCGAPTQLVRPGPNVTCTRPIARRCAAWLGDIKARDYRQCWRWADHDGEHSDVAQRGGPDDPLPPGTCKYVFPIDEGPFSLGRRVD